MLGGAFAVMRKPLFLAVGTPKVVTAQNLLGVTGDTPAVFYWGRAFRPLLGFTGVRRKQFCILNFEFLNYSLLSTHYSLNK